MWKVTGSFTVRDPRGLVRTVVEMTQVVEQPRLWAGPRQAAKRTDYMLADGTPLEAGPNGTFVIAQTREVLTRAGDGPRSSRRQPAGGATAGCAGRR